MRSFGIIVMLALSAFALTSCDGKKHEKPIEKAASFSGESLIVKTEAIDDIKRISALMTTRDTGEAVARISGVLLSLSVNEGDTVTKGQIIGTVSDQRLKFEASAIAATAAQAEADYQRIKTLYDQGIYAKARLEQAETARKAAQASKNAAYELSGQGIIRAPTSGTVIRASVPAGASIMAGTSIATITAGPRIVRLSLPEHQASSLSLGQIVSLDANGLSAKGTISQIYPNIENGQIIADITPDSLEGVLIGQRIEVLISLGKRSGFKLPKTYVSTRYGLDYVRLVGPDNALSDIPVQSAPLDDGFVEILSGLKEGDRLSPYGAR